jgi:alkyl hydroperoxide reductase subunit AhpC
LGQRAEEIRALGAGILAIAVTATFSQQAFAEALGVDFPLLSDWGRTTCASYGVRYEQWKGHAGLAKRSVFVVDRDRVIRYRWVTDDAHVLPDLDEAVGVLRACVGGCMGAGTSRAAPGRRIPTGSPQDAERGRSTVARRTRLVANTCSRP